MTGGVKAVLQQEQRPVGIIGILLAPDEQTVGSVVPAIGPVCALSADTGQ